jgi:hypothetical protein
MRGMVFQWKTFAAEERSERNKLIQELISNPAEESSKIKVIIAALTSFVLIIALNRLHLICIS